MGADFDRRVRQRTQDLEQKLFSAENALIDAKDRVKSQEHELDCLSAEVTAAKEARKIDKEQILDHKRAAETAMQQVLQEQQTCAKTDSKLHFFQGHGIDSAALQELQALDQELRDASARVSAELIRRLRSTTSVGT